MSNLVYLALLLVFLAILIVIRLTGDRRAVIALFGYVVAVHAVLAAAKRDAWPFATHGAFLEAGNEHRPLSVLRMTGVDRDGRERAIDARAWAPVSDRTLSIWWLMNRRRLSPQDQDDAMAFLLRKAQSRPANFLFAAPNWYAVERTPQWAGPPSALRVLLVTRVPAQKLEDGTESSQLIGQYPR